MRSRIISGIIGAIILIVALLSDKIYINIGVAIISFMALLEMYAAVGLAKYLPLQFLGLCATFAFTFSHALDNRLFMPIVYVYVILLFALYMLKDNHLKLSDISKMFFITVYISFFLGHIVFIRKLPMGNVYIWFVFICAFLTDVFAMLIGKYFGNHKLCPSISPKKTVEGAIGGIFGAMFGMLVYGLILEKGFGILLRYDLLLILGAVASIAAQFGDLAASVIKRQYEIKDYGNIMPGHGGVMDRFDSVLFTAPIIYYFVTAFPI